MINEPLTVGSNVSVRVGKIVHGGHFIAHHDGKTIFVRGAVDGEEVDVRITSKRKNVYFAETISIIEPSSYRVRAPCESSSDCGGCDFQYIDLAYQRNLKGQVLRESLMRFSGQDPTLILNLVEESVRELHSGDLAGSRWRHRSRFVWKDGWHMRRHSSHDLVSTPECTIITGAMQQTLNGVEDLLDGEYLVAEGINGVTLVSETEHISGPTYLEHTAFDNRWRVRPQAFWQADPNVIDAIAGFIDESRYVRQGESWWDLYGGSGVFAAFLASRVGHAGRVITVDADLASYEGAKTALQGHENIHVVHSNIEGFLRNVGLSERPVVQGVILDPPRSGAGESVIRRIMEIEPTYVVYIACDPVSLSRDIKFLGEKYRLMSVCAWDAFPMSYHFETVALLTLNIS